MAEFYAVGDKELLTATTIEDAVQEYLDEIEDVPETVKMQRYVPMKLEASHNAFDWAYKRMFESLDEDFDPEGNKCNKMNPEIIAAFDAFKAAVVANYSVWSCEMDGDPFEVVVRDYVEVEE